MREIFGVPAGTLATTLTIALAASLSAIVVLGLRNRAFVKLGWRSVVRRRGRSAIIVVGLMLATAIIGSALDMGDTMSSTIRSDVITTLGATDEMISVKGALNSFTTGDVAAQQAGATDSGYFPEAFTDRVRATVSGSPLVDGVMPAIIDKVAMQDETSRQNEPTAMLFAAPANLPEEFGTIRTHKGGDKVTLGDLGEAGAYLNKEAADELNARPGDHLKLLVGGEVYALTVRNIVDFDGAGTADSGVLVSLSSAQAMTDRAGLINHILVSNTGGKTSGVGHTDAVQGMLSKTLADLGLQSDPVKSDGLDQADAQGNAFMSLFTTFGTFTIAAGILLIFLIFVMLAAERRPELGAARAVGTQRGHLIQMFVFEGLLYDVLAALVGAFVGAAIAYGLVWVLASAFEGTGIDIRYAISTRSFFLAYLLGVILTLLVVTLSAWRVSLLNVVTAIRDLPEPPSHRRNRRRRWLAVGAVVFGVFMTMGGVSGKQGTPFLVGVATVIVGLTVFAASFGHERLIYTLGGLGLVAWNLLPFSVYSAIVPDLSMDFSVWIASSLMVVLGATWTLMFNADVILGVAMSLFGRIRRLAPVLKTSIAFPMRNRLRTGMTLAMFTLVVFTLVVGAGTSNSYNQALDNEKQFGGGFDVVAQTSPLSPVPDMTAAIAKAPGLNRKDFELTASQAVLALDAHQAGSADEPATYPVRGLDDAFIEGTSFEFAALAKGYGSSAAVWDALRTTPGLAVVDSFVVPRRSNFGFGVPPDFQLHGFYLEDETFEPVPVDVVDEQTGTTITLTVVGVLQETNQMYGLATSARTLSPLGNRVIPSVFYFKLANGVNADTTADTLESTFLANGMEAKSTREILDDVVGASLTFQRLVMGFLGLGLIIGVTALGVISARAVVERRQQIGVLRAVGFQRSMVQLSFVLEASFIALVSIVVGTGLGLIVGYNVVVDGRRQASWAHMAYAVPWPVLLIVFGTVYVAAIAATYVPARRAAHVHPAAALRYQ